MPDSWTKAKGSGTTRPRRQDSWTKAKGAKAKGKPKPKKEDGGWHNPFTGGANWIKESVLGIPGAGVALGEATENLLYDFAGKGGRQATRRYYKRDPKTTFADIGRAIEEDYAYRWGPLFQGHPLRFLERGSETGFLPNILDIGALASAGFKGATVAGVMKEAPRAVTFRSPGAIRAGLSAAEDPAAYVRPIHGSELSRKMKSGIVKVKMRLPKGAGEYYEQMRHARHTQLQNLKGYTWNKLKLQRREAVKRKMKVEELTAAQVRLQFPLRADFDSYKASLADVKTAGPTLRLLNDQKVLDYLDAPSPKMLKYEDETRKVVGHHETFFPEEAGLTLEQRRFLPTLIARGARYERVPIGANELPPIPEGMTRLFRGELEPDKWRKGYEAALEAKGLFKNTKGRWFSENEATARQFAGKGKVYYLDVEKDAVRKYIDNDNAGEFNDYLLPKELAEQKLPYGIAPKTRIGKTVAVPGRRGKWREGKVTSHNEDGTVTVRFGTTVTKKTGERKKASYTKAIPAEALHTPEQKLVGPKPIDEMIADVRAELQAANAPEPTYLPHASVEETGTGMGTGGMGVPRDPRFQKNRAILLSMGRVAFDIDALTPKYMRTIRWASYVDRHNELLAAGIRFHPDDLPADWRKKYVLVRQHLGQRLGYTKQTAAEFEARLAKHLDDTEDFDLAAGPTYENELTTLDEAAAAVDAEGRLIAVPKNYAKKITGQYISEGRAIKWLWDKPTDVWRAVVLNLRVGWLVNNIVGNSFLYILKNSGPEGLAAYARALRRSEGGDVFTEAQVMDLFPEQWHGTFGTTQMPEGLAGRITTSGKNPVQWLRKGDIYTERSARIAYLTRLAARSPEVKALVKQMEGRSKKWNEIAEEAIKRDPKLAERISEEVNAGLGDYFSMGEFERRAIRRVAPFYAWYKAITRITLMLPVDYPARAMILSRLGQIGWEFGATSTTMPWLEGGINLPGGGSVLGTQAMNPMGTVIGFGRAVGGDDWYSQQQRLGLLHPAINAIISAQGRRGGSFAPNVGRELWDEMRNLPPGRVFFPPDRESYEGSNYLRELFAYLGIPIKNPVEE